MQWPDIFSSTFYEILLTKKKEEKNEWKKKEGIKRKKKKSGYEESEWSSRFYTCVRGKKREKHKLKKKIDREKLQWK